MPKVSVIIPNYNHSRFLERRIDSILDQTFQDFEIIFLDDNSTDKSQDIFSKYLGNPKISHNIINEVNSNSTFKQWNRGIELAVGEYIWIAESDDYAAPRFLEALVSVLDRNDDIGIAYCQSFIIDEQDNFLAPNFLSCTDCLDLKKWTTNYLNKGIDECKNFLVGKNTIPNASAVLVRKSVYDAKVGRDNERFKVAGDWFTWLKILLASDVYFVAESLNYFRFCESSVSRQSTKLPIVVQESLSICQQVREHIDISQSAQEVFFNLVSSWWLTYFIVGCDFNWDREFSSYQKLLKLSPSYLSVLSLHSQLLVTPFQRFRYHLKLGNRLASFKKSLQYSGSNL